MKINIKRRGKDPGSLFVELKTGNSKIYIDPGIPVIDIGGGWGDNHDDITGVSGEKAVDGILISHFYKGSYSLSEHVDPGIHVYMSRGAKELYDIENIFAGNSSKEINCPLALKLRPFQIEDFKITPYISDFSAFDSLAFLVESDGKKIFYSYDARGKIKSLPEDIDCLLMGPGLYRGEEDHCIDENIARVRIEKSLRESNNITFLFAFPRNIERILSAYKTCLATGSVFVIDLHTAFILDKIRKVAKNIPELDRKNLRIKFTKSQAEALTKAGYRELLYQYNKLKIDMFEINRKKKNILMLTYDISDLSLIIKKTVDPSGADVIYSTSEHSVPDDLREYCARKSLAIRYVPISGQPLKEGLKMFSEVIHTGVIIPVWITDTDKNPGISHRIKILNSGEDHNC